VNQCWDLAGINRRYEEFIERYWPEYERSRSAIEAGEMTDEDAFVGRFALVHEYREFPLVDPYLPRPLQPAGWGGECSAALFKAYHDLLMPLADRYVDETLAAAPDTREAIAKGAA